tara:strand:+ start:520 stop:1317 length:798 start_codon:yes stop_codon:yes gene_type:complete
MADVNLQSKKIGAPRTRLSEFQGFFKGNDNHPSYSNRWSIQFAAPAILRQGKYFKTNKFDPGEAAYNRNLLNYYADNVNLPSKQVTTGSITNVGSSYNYATSSTFSQISMDFMVPRSHKTRMLFERWISVMSSDANQFTDYYDDYVCPNLYIFKWERGGGPEFLIPDFFKKILLSLGIDEKDVTKYKDDQLVGIYDIRNVFPYNIGSTTLNNAAASLQTFNVGFYYERYRFYGQPQFEDEGSKSVFSGQNELSPVNLPPSTTSQN